METHVIWKKAKVLNTQKKGHTYIHTENYTHSQNHTEILLLFALEYRSFTTCRVKGTFIFYKNKKSGLGRELFIPKNRFIIRPFIQNFLRHI